MAHPFKVPVGSGSTASPYWGNPVATPAALPALGLPGEARVVKDDGDGKTAIYVWNELLLSWEKVADPDNIGAGDHKVKVSSNDLLADYLINKIVSGSSALTITELNDGGIETLEVDAVVATTSQAGVVELATDGETAANVVVQGSDSRLSDSRPPIGTASGDLSGTYPSPTVVALQGFDVASTTPIDGDTLVWDNTASEWQPTAAILTDYQFISCSADIKVPASGTLYLNHGLNPTSVVEIPMLFDGSLVGAIITVDVSDATNDYDVEIYVNGILEESFSLANGNTIATDITFTTSISQNDLVAVLLDRTAGSGKSDFTNINLVLGLESN